METIKRENTIMLTALKWKTLLFSLLVLSFTGCGDSTFSGEQSPDKKVTAAKLIISTSSNVVQSDGSTEATITVLALDSSNGSLEGVDINFATSAGALSSSAAVTDAAGLARVIFSAGSDPSNQTATITASSGTTASASIPVDIIGSSVAITATTTNLIIDGSDTSSLTIKAVNSNGVGVFNTAVTLSIDAANSTGAANLSSLSGVTDNLGEFNVTLTGTSAGTVRVTADALNVSTFKDFLVENVVGSLYISAPATDTTAPLGVPATVTVEVPEGITSIDLVSSHGVWSGGLSNKTVAVIPPTTFTDTLTATAVGTASIQVSNSNDTSVNDSILMYFVDEVVDATSSIDLQASPTTIATSTSGTGNSSELTATVTNSSGGKIANARVTFALSNQTGSGEYISPPVAYTNAFGVASSTLFAGSQSTDNTGLIVTASLDPTLTAPATSSAQAFVIVGGTAGSISIGMSTTIETVNDNTGYALPISVQVTDSGGNPVTGTEVSLSLWPESYALGYWYCKPEPGLWRETILVNEDGNRNTQLDTGEDFSGDARLTPSNASAGSIPSSVTTDSNGIATFKITYLKDNAGFVYDALTASTLVQGTEAQTTRRFWLGASKSDISGCHLGDSPFNTSWPVLDGVSDLTVVSAGATGSSGGSSTITATLTANGLILDNQTINASIVSQGTFDTVAPTLSAVSQITDSNGQVSFTYTAGDIAGFDWIKLTYTTLGGTVISDYVLMTAE